MADIKISELILGGTIQDADLVETSKNVSTTPISRRQTYSQIYSYIANKALPTWTSINIITDSLILDISNEDGAIRRGASGANFVFDSNGVPGLSASITMIGSAASNSAFNTLLLGIDSFPRVNIKYDGSINFGNGTAVAGVALKSINPGELRLFDPTNVNSASQITVGKNATDTGWSLFLTGDTASKLYADYSGKFYFGNGSAPADIYLQKYTMANGSLSLVSTDVDNSFFGCKFQSETYTRATIFGQISSGLSGLLCGSGASDVDTFLLRTAAKEFTVSGDGGTKADLKILGKLTLNSQLGTIDPSAQFQVNFDPTEPTGTLLTKGTTAQRNSIVSPAEGLQFYDTDLHQFMGYNGTDWVILG